MIRLLVSGASAVTRAGLEALSKTGPALSVVGSSDVATLAQQVEELQPDVVLIDVDVGDDPLPVLPESGENAAAIVVLTDHPQGAWVADAVRSGVKSVLPRNATAGEIVAAVEAAAAGLVVLHPEVLQSLLPAMASFQRVSPAPHEQPLSAREVEVLTMLAEGLGNKVIAWRLGISEHTVKFHISSIFTKLKASSRTEAVILGIRQGWIML